MPGPPRDQPETVETLAPGVTVARSDLAYSFMRAAGPGGQSVNKVSSAVQLRVAVTAIRGLTEAAARRLRRRAGQRLTRGDEILIHARTHRSQLDNRRACLDRLRELVAASVPEPIPRKKMKPTRAMIRRRLEAKKRLSEKKQRRRDSRGGGD
ncbi:MAG: alternative ribosome rescue aminoacyl-tRNA hydrolase ArfB [Planctomycetota bacterium]|jgi:ribosome-associated protein